MPIQTSHALHCAPLMPLVIAIAVAPQVLEQCGALRCRLIVDAWDENIKDSALRVIPNTGRGKDPTPAAEQMKRDRRWWHARAKIRISGDGSQSGYKTYHELWRRKHGRRGH